MVTILKKILYYNISNSSNSTIYDVAAGSGSVFRINRYWHYSCKQMRQV